MNIEILWKKEGTGDFLADLKSFASELDFYQIIFDVESDKNKYLTISNSSYEILDEESNEAFECRTCANKTFEILEGQFQGKPALGLACSRCDSYGAIFPNEI